MLVDRGGTEGPQAWEDTSGLSLIPVAVGDTTTTLRIMRDAIRAGHRPVLLPTIHHHGATVGAIGVVLVSDDPRVLLRLPIPATAVILDDCGAVVYLILTERLPIQRVRKAARQIQKVTGGLAYP